MYLPPVPNHSIPATNIFVNIYADIFVNIQGVSKKKAPLGFLLQWRLWVTPKG